MKSSLLVVRAKLRTYYLLTKPGIIYGNGLTTIAGFLYATHNHFNYVHFLGAVLGSSLIIASGCVINNYLDRNIDKNMQRTKNRALVTGEISATNALVFGTILGIIGFVILALYVNWITVIVGLIGLIDYVILYGIGKRKSIHGTLVGSIAGSTPVLAGYTAVTNKFDSAGLLLFLIMAIWQMPHFYAIATYRVKEYKKASLPIWSVVKGILSTKKQIASYIAIYCALLLLFFIRGYSSVSFFVIMLGISFWWFWLAIRGFGATDDNKWGKKIFGASLLVLMVFSVMLSLNYFLP